MGNMVSLHNDWSNIPLDHSVEYIYHYTSKIGLDGIFSNKQLWACDIYKQNDKSEGIYVLDLLENNIDSLCSDRKIKDAILKQAECLKPKLVDGFCYSEKYRSFIISFSTAKDELALWNYYTKDADSVGYNIKFEVSVLNECLRTKRNKSGENGSTEEYFDNIKCKHGKVFYNTKKQLDIIEQIIHDYSKYYSERDDTWAYLLVDKILWVGTFFKNPHFKHEYEYRFAFFTQTDKSMPGFWGLPLEFEGEKKNHIEIYFNTAAIRQVICSPTNSSKQIQYPQKYKSDCYQNFKSVTLSEIPFRVI